MNTVVISLGSNIDPQDNIDRALHLLANHFTIIKQSPFIQTTPVGYKDQDDFINGSILIETDQDQKTLKATLKVIEKKLGRKKSAIKCGPRTIDLDITVFNNQIIDEDFYQRDFVQNAVLELIPNLTY